MAPNGVGEVEGAGLVIVWRVSLRVSSLIIMSMSGEAGDLLPSNAIQRTRRPTQSPSHLPQ